MPVTTTDEPVMEREITLTRRLAAPRELVFRAFTERAHLERWWGPHGMNTRVDALELKPGGAYDMTMRGPGGVDYPMKAVIQEIAPPARLSFRFTAQGSNGETALEGVTTVVLTETDGHTELTLNARATGLIPQAAFMLAGMNEGWSQSLERLTALLQSQDSATTAVPGFSISRTFDAPRELVFKVLSQPEHLARWWGPKGWEFHKCTLDFRQGGQFHYCMAMPGGPEMWGRFVYHEIEAPSRIVFANAFSDAQGGLTRHPMAPTWPQEVLNILTLEEQDGRTTLNLQGYPLNASPIEQQTFAAEFESMRMGFGGTFDQLADYLKELQTA